MRFTVLSILLGCVLTALPALQAQSVPTSTSLATGNPAHSGVRAQSGCVRDSNGNLYASVIYEVSGTWPVQVLVSNDQGQTWATLLLQVNDASSGLLPGPNNDTQANESSLAIDDQDRLHIRWSSFHYPSFFECYYRTYDLGTGVYGPIVNLNSQLGISTSSRTAASAIRLDAQNLVWMTSPSSSNWREQLLVSTQPYAANGQFSSVGVVSTTASAQTTKLAIDTAGRVHCLYYQNVPPGVMSHRYYDSNTQTWGTETVVGDNSAPNDTRSTMCSDYNGNVHALIVRDAINGGGTTLSPKFVYRSWDVTNGWSSPTVLASFTTSQMGSNHSRVSCIQCNQATGDVFVVYRDFSGNGALKILRKAFGAGSFQVMPDLAPASTTTNEYDAPFIRGTLHPAANNCTGELDVFWRQGGGSPWSFEYVRRHGSPLATVSSVGTGCTGTSGTPAVLAGGPPMLGDGAYALDVSGGPAGAQAWVFLSFLPATNPVSIAPGCDILLDLNWVTFLINQGYSPLGPATLDGGGAGQVPFPLPYVDALAGARLTLQGLITDPGAPAGIVLTNMLDTHLGY